MRFMPIVSTSFSKANWYYTFIAESLDSCVTSLVSTYYSNLNSQRVPICANLLKSIDMVYVQKQVFSIFSRAAGEHLNLTFCLSNIKTCTSVICNKMPMKTRKTRTKNPTFETYFTYLRVNNCFCHSANLHFLIFRVYYNIALARRRWIQISALCLWKEIGALYVKWKTLSIIISLNLSLALNFRAC